MRATEDTVQDKQQKLPSFDACRRETSERPSIAPLFIMDIPKAIKFRYLGFI